MQDRSPAESSETFLTEGSAATPSDRAVLSLAREVVLRLSRNAASRGALSPEAIEDAAVVRYCTALTSSDGTYAAGLAREDLDGGMSFDQLCETRLAPAARRLGVLWEQDELSFAEVTLACNRLFSVLRTLAQRPPPAADTPFAIFAAVPGEEHVLGVSMAAERARGAGWEVTLCLGLPHDRLVEKIAAAAPDVIGLSLTSDRMLLPLMRLIVSLRIEAPLSPIVVCGPGVAELTEPLVGADAVTADFERALAAMRRLTA